MNTKEAVEFVEEIKKYFDSVCNHKANETINLLKRGEKYEQMWKKIEKHLKERELMRLVGKMKSIKQKYFPQKEDSIKELSELVNKMKEVIDKHMITMEELNERLTPKD